LGPRSGVRDRRAAPAASGAVSHAVSARITMIGMSALAGIIVR